ncbi:unnamed protein product [Diamesa serratosioi]
MNMKNFLVVTLLVVVGVVSEVLSAPSGEASIEEKKQEKIGVEDTPDEFEFHKPSETDQKYDDFLDELYAHDAKKDKENVRVTRDAPVEAKLEIEQTEFDIPKPSNTDEKYEEFLDHLYRKDAVKEHLSTTAASRKKRMIVFRPLFVYRKKEISKAKRGVTKDNLTIINAKKLN